MDAMKWAERILAEADPSRHVGAFEGAHRELARTILAGANRWRPLDKDHVPSGTLLLLIDKDDEVRLGRWVGYWAMDPGGPFEPVGWAFLPMWVEGEVRKPSEEEPQLRFCTLRDDFDGIGPDPSGWSLECRFSDGQKYGAVTIDRPFEKLAVQIMNFLNGETS